MARELQVYGYMGHRSHVPKGQTREIVAAHSGAEMRRITGITASWYRDHCSVTGNPEEVELAMTNPGEIFWRPLVDMHSGKESRWKRGDEEWEDTDSMSKWEPLLGITVPDLDDPEEERKYRQLREGRFPDPEQPLPENSVFSAFFQKDSKIPVRPSMPPEYTRKHVGGPGGGQPVYVCPVCAALVFNAEGAIRHSSWHNTLVSVARLAEVNNESSWGTPERTV